MNIIKLVVLVVLAPLGMLQQKQLCTILSKTVLRKIYVISLSGSLCNYWLLLRL